MSDEERKRVNLNGGLKQMASSVEIRGDGSLVIELYDFSSEAEQWFGNDVAFILTVSASDKHKVLERLIEEQTQTFEIAEPDDLLLLMTKRFRSYHEVKSWLDENDISYHKEFVPWA